MNLEYYRWRSRFEGRSNSKVSKYKNKYEVVYQQASNGRKQWLLQEHRILKYGVSPHKVRVYV